MSRRGHVDRNTLHAGAEENAHLVLQASLIVPILSLAVLINRQRRTTVVDRPFMFVCFNGLP